MLRVENLTKSFTEPSQNIRELLQRKQRRIYAVDDVSLTIEQNEVLGIVGESGSGKSTLAKTIARIYEPDSGKIIFMGEDITHLDHEQLTPYRRRIQIVFQNPYSSLNPRRKIRDIIGDPVKLHRLNDAFSVQEALEAVGLSGSYAERYPHQLSGGERQRVAIARALALHPSLIIADEITSSIDVSTQMQILKLLMKIKNEYQMSMLFISHDLAVVNYVSDRIMVMYAGKIIEEGRTDEIINNPAHPYTKSLVETVPDPFKKWNPQVAYVEDTTVPSSGCKFSRRCPYALEKCYRVQPQLIQVSEGHKTACFLYEKHN